MLSTGQIHELFIKSEQGFVDRFGKFHNREEAWKIAEPAGQIRRRVGGDTINGGTLFSENLYWCRISFLSMICVIQLPVIGRRNPT